ncbi:MAG: hypothetical protein M0Q38_10275 [Bacteroidales bacterium]|jgi:hypothetical protein|nr:hypothetical protein [Bacteroidales bacterium]
MEKSLKHFLFFVILFFIMTFSLTTIAQGPMPPPPPGEKGSNNNQAPAGAPIDGGLSILLVLAGAYGSRKWVRSRKKMEEFSEN